ncbi:MAG: glutamine--tRNA ligase, partial [Gammaproteobacteria bacterium]|nr:glutamine--tRNA ligase [Gammaproteobacteria bacterium]
SRSGSDTSGLKPKGVIHWVSAQNAQPMRVRLYDRLFSEPNPKDLDRDINPNSLVEIEGYVEPAIVASDDSHFQFERLGYFCKDNLLPGVVNRTVSLRDSWKP